MLGSRIKELRNERGLYQQQLADALSVSKSTVAMWETNKREPDLEMLKKMAEFFDVSVDYLTGKSYYRNYQDYEKYCWGVTSDEYFDAAFDFCPLLKELREEQDVTIAEMSNVLHCTEEQYQDYEGGTAPITYEQAEELCNYLDTNVSQVLFDNELYDEQVPEQYHDDIRKWEKFKESYYGGGEDYSDEPKEEYEQDQIKIIARHLADVPKEDRDQLIKNFEQTIDIYLTAKGLKKKDNK